MAFGMKEKLKIKLWILKKSEPGCDLFPLTTSCENFKKLNASEECIVKLKPEVW